MLDYFYGGQADLFSFYRLPKALFVDPRFRGISAEAKILYGLLLDRMGLSVKNGWMDDTGKVYIIFTTEEIMEALCCADNKATKLMKELEGCGLIERKRRGLGKPSLTYVKNFITTNFENVLGTSIFMMMCSSLPYPVMTPDIEDILKTAPLAFKQNPLVKDYVSKAKENMKLIEENKRLQENMALNK